MKPQTLKPQKIALIAEPMTKERLIKHGRSLPELPGADSGDPVLIAESWLNGGPVDGGWVMELWGYERCDTLTLMAWQFEDVRPGERVRKLHPIADLSDKQAQALLHGLRRQGKNAKQPLTIKVPGGSVSFFDTSGTKA